jgi:Family of unknown function (DUF5684)
LEIVGRARPRFSRSGALPAVVAAEGRRFSRAGGARFAKRRPECLQSGAAGLEAGWLVTPLLSPQEALAVQPDLPDFRLDPQMAEALEQAQVSGLGAIGWIIQLALVVLIVAGWWMVFTKAGKQGWMAIVPILNVVILLEIIGKPLWWVILFFIPCVNFVVAIIVGIEVAKCFGKGAGFGLGLGLLPMIFYPILGFSDARYRGPSRA